ncbi:MAG: hypothetical protein J6X80_08480 [Lachnospiraceae bacterium]|nr:hypothetical protein [Lachnospiraceae bacterium]
MPDNKSNNRRTAGRPSGHPGAKKKKRKPNYPRIFGWSFGLILVVCIILIVLRILVWDKGVKYEMTAEDYERINLDTLDNVILWPSAQINTETYDGVTDVLVFGNDSFREGSDKGESIMDMFKKEVESDTVKIYDCCLPGSYLTSFNETEASPEECPEDYFTLFWLILNSNSKDFSKQNTALKYLDSSKYDIDRYKEVLSILEDVNYENIDVIMLCYDGHDYLYGKKPINYNIDDPDNAQTENVATELGALYVWCNFINTLNPHIQFVFVSPAFCYAENENGKMVSSAIYDTGYGTIGEYIYTARYTINNYYPITYVDIYNGVLINEDNGKHYLENDGITPKEKARKMITDRLVYVLKERL